MGRNHGTMWCNREHNTLWSMIHQGYGMATIAKTLGRTPSACRSRLTALRVGLLWRSGSEDDTLRSWAKREENK